MRYFSVLLLLVLLSTAPQAQLMKPAVSAPTNPGPNDTLVTFDPDNQKRELLIVKNGNGVILSRGYRLNGLKDGVWREYNQYGTVTRSDEYKKGRKSGATLLFSQQGLLMMDFNYLNDTLEGQQTTYLTNGHIKLIENYKHGLLEGQRTFSGHL